jgi:hypothetical protein
LLKRAALFAFSSWRFTRSLRIGEEQFQRKNPAFDHRYSVTSLRRQELVALRRLGQALRDAGYYLDASFAAWLLLALLPDELMDDPGFRQIGDDLAGTLRGAGLAVPSRFVLSKKERNDRANKHPDISIARDGEVRVTDLSDTADKEGAEEHSDPLRRRLELEKKTDVRWQEINRLETDQSNDPFGTLARVVKRRKELTEDVKALRAAFGLCLRYSRLKESAQVATCLQLNENELLDLAHSVKRALQLNLLAVDPGRHIEWREVLRASWTQLPNRAAMNEDAVLALHEVLLGRYPSIVRDAGSDIARSLALKLYNQLDDEDLRELIDVGARAFRRGLSTVTIETLQRSLKAIEDGPLGAPICVSVARLSDDSVSMIAIAPGEYEKVDIALPGIGEAPASVRSTYVHWLRHDPDRILKVRVPWHSSLEKLGEAIVHLTSRRHPSRRWVALALEPDLASLPWASLLDAGARKLIVTLMPSLSWFARAIDPARHKEDATTRGVSIIISRDEDLSLVASRIQRDTGLLRELIGSCGVVLGHGRMTDKGGILVAAENGEVTVDRWLNLAGRRVLIVHSCHSGRVSQSFPSDLGGVPGLALSLGCRLFLAPVTEVPPGAAVALHDELVRQDGAPEIGLRYLAAIQNYPAASLYNMYGFANERVY